MSGFNFYNVRSCNDDYVPRQPVYTFTSSTRDENADEPWSPRMRMAQTDRPQPPFTGELLEIVPVNYTDKFSVTRSTCEPNELEKKRLDNTIVWHYNDANIGFGTSKGEFTLTQSFEPDARLEAIDAAMEAFYKTETTVMELNLSEPEDEERPSFIQENIREEELGLAYYHYCTNGFVEKKNQ